MHVQLYAQLRKIPIRASHAVSEMEKQNVPAKKVYMIRDRPVQYSASFPDSSSFPREREQEKGREEERPCERGCARFWPRGQNTTR